MDIDDLRLFEHVARSGHLRQSADALHLSASAVSKAIRRLEATLQTALFERRGRSLRLNAQGARLLERSRALLDLADETRSEFVASRTTPRCRIAAPALLQWRFAAPLATALQTVHAEAELAFDSAFEDAAADRLAAGHADFALISGAVTAPAGSAAIALGRIEMQLCAAATHPLLAGRSLRGNTVRIAPDAVFKHAFAAPSRSFFCGIERGAYADGWRRDARPRRLRYRIDDLRVLIELVRTGLALAYLPDFAVRESGLVRLQLREAMPECVESIYLLWRPTAAHGWHRRMVDAVVRNAA